MFEGEMHSKESTTPPHAIISPAEKIWTHFIGALSMAGKGI